MRRTTSDRSRQRALRSRPSLEALEQRRVLSEVTGVAPISALQTTTAGRLLHNNQTFVYRTPRGTNVKIQMVGRGSLEGTTVDQNGVLHLQFSKTNSYTKIVSTVHGGNGQADLGSIYPRDLVLNNATQSLSGIGGTLIDTINLMNFNLVPGGVISVAEGINLLGLNSAGPNTQIRLRELPSTVTAGQGGTVNTGPGGSSSSNSAIISDAFLVQGLAGVNGEFVSAGNILLQSDPTNPGPPPAPPGVVIRINHIRGNVAQVPNLLTDARTFGYNETTGQVVRFALDLTKAASFQGTGTVDTSFTPIQVQAPGSTAPVGLSVGRSGNRLVLLVASGTTVSAYDATYGTSLGSFTIPAGFDALGSTDTVSVIGSVGSNQLQMLDIAASLASGVATPPADNPAPYTPPPGLELVGGLTGISGSNRVYSTIAATFNSFQPNVTQLGLLTTSASVAVPKSGGGLDLVNRFSTDSQKAIQVGGSYVPVDPGNNPDLIGVPLGSVDTNLALNTATASSSTPGAYRNVVSLLGPVTLSPKGSITLNTTGRITDLSETFRPDLDGSTAQGTGPALIDVQGNIQSFRGLTANGLILNNTGSLNLLKTGRLSNSVILALPIGHVETTQAHRTNVTLISSANRLFETRGGVTLVPGLDRIPIGPLSLTNDVPPPSTT
ncbi:MAG: hypothetical protein U0790_25465 [Isosphaeraceae bacterium]